MTLSLKKTKNNKQQTRNKKTEPLKIHELSCNWTEGKGWEEGMFINNCNRPVVFTVQQTSLSQVQNAATPPGAGAGAIRVLIRRRLSTYAVRDFLSRNIKRTLIAQCNGKSEATADSWHLTTRERSLRIDRAQFARLSRSV
jgi:hypothetical protein